MSEHDDTLLDEDLGDEEYDLGNDEEEALLADDYELERQNSYKGEEETDDVLDLGVTDALDDLDGEDENIEFSRSKTDKNNDNDFYEDGEHQEVQSKYYEQDENNEYKSERQYEEHSAGDSVNVSSNIGKGDLREKLQKTVQKIYIGNGKGLEDDDCEEAKERRNRFQNERTIVSPKMNNNIPDTLENVVTSEPSRSFRGRGRGRSTRGGCRGGRFNIQNTGNFNPRFATMRNSNFDNQQPVCRPPLLETRPPFLLGVPNNVQNQQLIYQQTNPQVQHFQHFSPNGPLQGPTHFVDNRPQFSPNQFQGQVGPRVMGPRLDYGPRGNLTGSLQGPPYNCPSNQPPYVQIQPGPFQNTGGLLPDNPGRLMQGNQGPLLQGNSGGSLLGNPNPLVPGTPGPLIQGNQAHPMQGFPRQQGSSQGPPINHPNVQIPNQSPFENRPPFQESQFESRPVYDSRSGYSDQVPPTSQFNSNTLPVPQQSSSNVPNVPLPPGHKILINPHFRGAVQPTNDARLVWDSTQQQPPLQSQVPGNQFPQSLPPYQNQGTYNQGQPGVPHYQQKYQQNKSDDPYAYFSDVWQENKPQKTQGGSPLKQYPPDSNYPRESSYNDSGMKYKSDSQWDPKDSYEEDHRGIHQNYRERDLPSKPRSDHMPKSRPLSSNTYRDNVYDQNHAQKPPNSRSVNTAVRGVPRLPQKRVSEPLDRPLRDLSPKRMKQTNRNLQEVQTVDTLSDVTTEKKDEESDPEMQEYRKKMEEQKRLREKILREKENRRKMAAMEKQNEEAKIESNTTSNEGTQQDTKPVSALMGVVKDAVANKGHSGVGRGRARPVSTQATEAVERMPGTRIVRTIQTIQSTESLDSVNIKDTGHGLTSETVHSRYLGSQSGTRRVVIQKPLVNSQKIATTIQKTVSNLQKGQVQNKLISTTHGTVQKVVQTQSGALKKLTVSGQKNLGNPQRVVTQKGPMGLQKTVINIQDTGNINAQKVVNTQNNQRIFLQKTPIQQKKLLEIKTNTVKLENLAASTSEAQIRRMCQGIGTIESIQMGERSATIVFKTQSAAMVFHKKYQRKMLDLSLITVRLVPQSSGTKTTTTVVKVS